MNSFLGSDPAWLVLGLSGQMLFASRFVVQWWATERRRRVVVPTLFWYLSIAGGIGLLVYALHRRDPVFAIGQSIGLLVYGRNLVHARRDAEA